MADLSEKTEAESLKEKEFLTVKEVSSFLSLSPSTVYRHIKSGLFPSEKKGRKILIPRKNLLDHFNNNYREEKEKREKMFKTLVEFGEQLEKEGKI